MVTAQKAPAFTACADMPARLLYCLANKREATLTCFIASSQPYHVRKDNTNQTLTYWLGGRKELPVKMIA